MRFEAFEEAPRAIRLAEIAQRSNGFGDRRFARRVVARNAFGMFDDCDWVFRGDRTIQQRTQQLDVFGPHPFPCGVQPLVIDAGKDGLRVYRRRARRTRRVVLLMKVITDIASFSNEGG